MADIYGRPILPQAAFAWQPPVTDRQPKQTNYVFVDEHNRSRRLKVMRACENCRKRKIKCDAATTNSWPCGACTKQRLHCAPPVLNLEKGEIPELSTRETPIKKENMFQKPAPSKPQAYPQKSAVQQPTSAPYQPQGIKSNVVYSSEPPTTAVYQTEKYTDIPLSQTFNQAPSPPAQQQQAAHSIYEQSNTEHALSPARSASTWSETPETDLTDTMKDLNISDVGLAPYINNQKSLADKAAVHDTELSIPIPNSPDGQVRIPDAMMPSDKQAMLYFDYFFENVHPYLPVLNKDSFLHQWSVDKQSISPLILEAIFAITTQLLHPSPETNQWLALAAHHEKAFDDVSRLSTVQGLLLLLKARESVPKRGYYWRSWMHIVKIVHMGKDLELGQHLELHEMGKSCGSSSRVECHTKTRTWQACFILELMIGGPQGRTYSVPLDSVDFEFPDHLKYTLGDPEERISRQFTLFAKAIKNVRLSLAKYAELRKLKTDWAMDESFQGYNKIYDGWLRNLPDQFQIYFPQDSSTPQIPSHFIANLHSYYYLSIVMHHRPQLQAAQTKGPHVFMSQLIICYTAATRLCRLQEAILEEYGLEGFLWMLRGVNFGIYSVITSTMLHLVALTCPDPTLNYDAMDYFPRHMRILERCTENWSMPEIQAQVQSLRDAFSADPTKPFELRADFPRVDSSKGSPKSDSDVTQMHQYSSVEPLSQTQFSTMPMQQSMFQGVRRQSDVSPSTMPNQDQFIMGYGPDFADYTSHSSHHYDNWDPSKISALWNTAFEPPPTAYEQGSPSQQGTGTTPPSFQPQFTQNVTNVTNVQYNTYTQPQFPTTGANDGTSPSSQWSTYQAPQMQTFVTPAQQPQPQAQQGTQASTQLYTPFSTPASITPGMWQDAVASSYGLGSKRHFSDASETQIPAQKRAK